jgi:hypothetical protein
MRGWLGVQHTSKCIKRCRCHRSRRGGSCSSNGAHTTTAASGRARTATDLYGADQTVPYKRREDKRVYHRHPNCSSYCAAQIRRVGWEPSSRVANGYEYPETNPLQLRSPPPRRPTSILTLRRRLCWAVAAMIMRLFRRRRIRSSLPGQTDRIAPRSPAQREVG